MHAGGSVTTETPDQNDACEIHPLWVGAVIDRDHWHFHSQLLRRYGVVLGPGEFSGIVKAIERGEALLVVRRKKRGTAIYAVMTRSVPERLYVLAYGSQLVTAWPREARFYKRCQELLDDGPHQAGVTGRAFIRLRLRRNQGRSDEGCAKAGLEPHAAAGTAMAHMDEVAVLSGPGPR